MRLIKNYKILEKNLLAFDKLNYFNIRFFICKIYI